MHVCLYIYVYVCMCRVYVDVRIYKYVTKVCVVCLYVGKYVFT